MCMENMGIRIGIENGRAKYAFETVSRFVELNSTRENELKEYRSYVKKLPAMIQVNGLGQTLAFCYAKGNQYKAIYDQIETWVSLKQNEIINRYEQNENMEFVQIIVSMNSNDYRIISNEVLALLSWMRRFADGMIRDLT
jgi:CRISPR-associated protein Cmr5